MKRTNQVDSRIIRGTGKADFGELGGRVAHGRSLAGGCGQGKRLPQGSRALRRVRLSLPVVLSEGLPGTNHGGRQPARDKGGDRMRRHFPDEDR